MVERLLCVPHAQSPGSRQFFSNGINVELTRGSAMRVSQDVQIAHGASRHALVIEIVMISISDL